MNLIMNYLIKILIIFFITFEISFAEERLNIEKIIFKINNKAITTIELENRKNYYKLIFNDLEYNHQNLFDDLISLRLFNEYFIETNKKKKYNLNETYLDIFQKYTSQDNELSKIFNKLGKDVIIENLEMDLKRKLIIEEILNSKKDLIINETNESEMLYQKILKYFIINKNDYNIVKDIVYKKKLDEENKIKELLEKHEIKFFYKQDLLNNDSIINKKIKNKFTINENIFEIEDNDYIILGIIQKKLKTYDGINVQLVNLEVKDKLTAKELKCNNLNNINKENVINLTSGNYAYNSLNDLIKDNLYLVDNYIQLSGENSINYIMLCALSFDKQLVNEISISQRVNNLASEIERDFVKKYSKIYNLLIINE